MIFVTYFPYCGGPFLFLDPVFLCKNGSSCDQIQACKEAGNNRENI